MPKLHQQQREPTATHSKDNTTEPNNTHLQTATTRTNNASTVIICRIASITFRTTWPTHKQTKRRSLRSPTIGAWPHHPTPNHMATCPPGPACGVPLVHDVSRSETLFVLRCLRCRLQARTRNHVKAEAKERHRSDGMWAYSQTNVLFLLVSMSKQRKRQNKGSKNDDKPFVGASIVSRSLL